MRDLADEMRKALAGDGDLDALRRPAAPGVGAEAVARLRDQHRPGRRVVRGGPPDGRRPAASCSAPAAAASCSLMAPPWRHRAIREALGRPRELPFRIARHGSRNIFIQQ